MPVKMFLTEPEDCYSWWKSKGTGRTIIQEIEYAADESFARYSGYETLLVSPNLLPSIYTFNIWE